MYNVLKEPIFRITTPQYQRITASLPETLGLAVQDNILSFSALRPHQRHAWHAFLSQLGALALDITESTHLPTETDAWETLLRNLTPEFPEDEPWQITVEDITLPAFLQPPARLKTSSSDYKDIITAPDSLDMLVQSKNHDLKSNIATVAGLDDWVYALITLQTTEGFSGAGNYGISRMNGGLGSRSAFSLTPSLRPGAHIARDIAALLANRESVLSEYSMASDGLSLLWTIPWDGSKGDALSWQKLDPYYIEICRRIRLFLGNDGKILGRRATSKAARINAKELKGRTGDPWIPINRKEGKSLTLAYGGFTYKRILDYLLSSDWKRPVLCDLLPQEKISADTVYLVARGMVRGQGKTEGYYERIIPLKPRTRSAAFGSSQEAQRLHDLARERIDQIATVQRFLRHAIALFAARGDSEAIKDSHWNLTNTWIRQLDQVLDSTFFDCLQEEFEAEGVEQRNNIRDEWLHNNALHHAFKILDSAINTLPCPSIEVLQASVAARTLFAVRLRSNQGLPHLFSKIGEESNE